MEQNSYSIKIFLQVQSKLFGDMENRIKMAVEFLKDGQSFKVGDLRLGVENPGSVYVTGWSTYNNLENLTKQIALKELQEIKGLFQKMVNASPELKEFIQYKSVEFNLAFDYGQGAIGVCSEKDEKIVWETDLK